MKFVYLWKKKEINKILIKFTELSNSLNFQNGLELSHKIDWKRDTYWFIDSFLEAQKKKRKEK